ncbi:helix-turn-helix domain-containing protein [Nocardioides zeae]|uniref:Helix-turn-helix domain-containing protein n=1 Tax=Nocardioides imazamoxiresistens TaxID=3231893 RepID=A0ABU3PT46_9ACTN|nr:helix-turn-helix domain-containing protein [Nocardioides zeae]MDT9592017.1 helix-turn-helix domain-containing protein [Nocardioides zeae]
MTGGSTRAAVSEEVLSRLDHVADEITAEIVAQIPAYAALAPAQIAEVAAIARWGTTRVLHLWVEGAADLTEADVRRFRGIGAARALDGRPLPGVLRAYRLAAARVVDLVEVTATDHLTVGDALALSRLWMAVVDTLSEALYEGYTASVERVGDRASALEDLLDDLLVGRQVARTNLHDRARKLGVSIPPRPTLLVLRADRGPTHDELAGIIGDEVLLRHREGNLVALLDSGAARRTAESWPGSWPAALVPADDVNDLPRSFRLAAHALDHAPQHAHRDRLLDEADAQLVALLTDHPDTDRTRFDRLVLGRLADDPDLLESVRAHLATGTAEAAAAQLGIHPQTLRHRLRRVRELTGRDPRILWDRLVLEAALVNRG